MKESRLMFRSKNRRFERSRKRASSSLKRGLRAKLGVESLESRTLLAGDLLSPYLASSLGDLPGENAVVVSAPIQAESALSEVVSAEGEAAAEGEDQADLVGFAKALTDAGVKFFGTAWCAHCTAQKETFEDGAKYLPFIEVTNPDRTLNEIGQANNITVFPTWEFQDSTRLTGALTLQQISDASGIAIPTSSDPSLAEIEDTTLLVGSPLHVPLDGYDPNGDTITYTITSDNPDVTPTLLSGNRSMVVDVFDYGKMVFQLFEQRAERPTERVITLAEDDFYDGLIFHRIIEGFVIQGGDPTGTGSGGSTLGDFDDQFNVDIQHNRTGLLSYAKTTDDTNDSQFFVTLDPLPGGSYPRHLDFNHSVFGVLVEGYSNLGAIARVPTTSSSPDLPVVMNSVDVFTDTENGVVMLKAVDGASGEANITVTATDSEGNSTQQTFTVTLADDTINGGPFLEDIAEVTTNSGTPVEIPLSALDVEGDAVFYDATARGSVNYVLDVNNQTGVVTVTPPDGFVGDLEFLATVRSQSGPNSSGPFDEQLVTVTVEAGTPVLDLLPVSDTNIDDDNITSETNMQFRVSNVVDGATVQILNGTTVIGQGTAAGDTIDITTNNLSVLGDGAYTLHAVQIVGVEESDPSEDLVVTLDTIAPPAFTTTPPTAATNGDLISYDAENPEEGSGGFTYVLIGAPAGAAINSTTGVFTWSPTSLQGGVNAFQIQGMDAAGNTVLQDVSIDVTVVPQLVQIRLEFSNLNGDVITTIDAGQDFFLDVYVTDVRDSAQGVFAAYMDIEYDAGLVSSIDQVLSDITFGFDYLNGKSGSFSEGLIDEVGAFGPTSPLGPDERLVFSVQMSADTQGTAEFTGNGAEGIGHEFLLFGTNFPVEPNEVTYLPGILTIVAGLEAKDDLFNFDEDTQDNSLPVLDNDENSSVGELTITDVSDTAEGGTVEIAADGKSLIYTPPADFFGEDTLTYHVTNGSGTSSAQVTVQLAPVNDSPTANNDSFTVTEETTDNFLNVLGNDEVAPDTGETLRVIQVDTAGVEGTITIAPNGTHLLYTPKTGFVGEETFTYTIRDRDETDTDGLNSTATVTVIVQSATAPTAVDDTKTVDEDSFVTEIDVLANDTPHESGKDLEITGVTQSDNGGTVTIVQGAEAGQDKISYTPRADFFGTDTFTYTITEEDGGTATGTVTVTVDNINDAPTAVDDAISVVKDSGTTTLDVLDNDTIAPDEGETLEITEVSEGSAGGTITISADGKSIEYTPVAGFEGTETFTYTVDDGSGEDNSTDQATVTVQVLEYTPRSFSGDVMYKEDVVSFGGLDVQLSGKDNFGNDVLRDAVTPKDGTFYFADLAPGNFELKTAVLPFVVTPSPRAIESTFDEGDSTGNDLEVTGRLARFLTIADFVASAPLQSHISPESAIIAALVPGVEQVWYAVESGWGEFVDGKLTLSADSSELTIEGTHEDGTVYQGTVSMGNRDRIKRLGNDGDTLLVRVYGGTSELNMQPIGSSSSSGGEGEPGAATQSASEASYAAAVDQLMAEELLLA